MSDLPTARRGRWSVALALLGTVPLALLAALVLLPTMAMPMLPGVVVATEYSPPIALLTLGWLLVARALLRGRARMRAVVTVVLLAAAAIDCWPLARFDGVAQAASEQLGTDEAVRYSLLDAFRPPRQAGAVRERTVAYSAADGSPLELRLFTGPVPGARPTVVVIYGGAWRGGEPTQAAGVSRALASRGYTVAAIDYRHAPAARYPAQLQDVRRSLALLRDSAVAWQVDPARLALLGRSAGGHLAELAAWAPGAPPVRAVVSLYAPFDLVQGYVDLPSPDPIDVRAVLRDFLGGTPAQQPARYREASPATWVRPGLPPTLLLFGGRDRLVKPLFNRGAAARLRAADVPVIAVEVPWAEHGFDMAPGGLGAQLAMHVIGVFLEKQLR